MSEHLHLPASVTTSYAEISATGNTTETTITTTATWYQITIFDTNGVSNDSTPDHTNDHITVGTTGTYRIMVTCSVSSGSGAAGIYECVVQKNNGDSEITNLHWHRMLSGGGGDTGSASASGLAALTAADTIELWISNETNATNILFEDVTMSIVQVA